MINMLIEFFKRFRKKPKPNKPELKAQGYHEEYILTADLSATCPTKPKGRRPLSLVPPQAPDPDYGYQARNSSSHRRQDDTDYIVPLVVAAALFSGDNSSGSTSSDSPAFD